MSLTASFAPHLPYLRRYARALTGSQRSGDAYVRASLEALVAGEKELATDTTPRVALYHLFHVIWASSTTDPQDRAPAPTDTATPDGRLQSLMRSNREALLLTAVEGFSPRETARILGNSRAFNASGLAMSLRLARRIGWSTSMFLSAMRSEAAVGIGGK